MDTLIEATDQTEGPKVRVEHYSQECTIVAQHLVNNILNNIITNTYACLQLKWNIPQWYIKHELFDLRIIDK